MSASQEQVETDCLEVNEPVAKDYIGSEQQSRDHDIHFRNSTGHLNTMTERFERFAQVARFMVGGRQKGELPVKQYRGRNLLYLAWQADREELRSLYGTIQGHIDAMAAYEDEPVLVRGIDFLGVDNDPDINQNSIFYGKSTGLVGVDIKTNRIAKGILDDFRCVYGGLHGIIRGNVFMGSENYGYRKLGKVAADREIRLISLTATAHASLVGAAEPLRDPLAFHEPFKTSTYETEVLYGSEAKETADKLALK